MSNQLHGQWCVLIGLLFIFGFLLKQRVDLHHNGLSRQVRLQNHCKNVTLYQGIPSNSLCRMPVGTFQIVGNTITITMYNLCRHIFHFVGNTITITMQNVCRHIFHFVGNTITITMPVEFLQVHHTLQGILYRLLCSTPVGISHFVDNTIRLTMPEFM